MNTLGSDICAIAAKNKENFANMKAALAGSSMALEAQ
jgi:hypothetical protein